MFGTNPGSDCYCCSLAWTGKVNRRKPLLYVLLHVIDFDFQNEDCQIANAKGLDDSFSLKNLCMRRQEL